MTTLSTNVVGQVQSNFTKTVGVGSASAAHNLALKKTKTWADGGSSGQANTRIEKAITIPASSSTEYDVNGAEEDVWGEIVSMTNIRAVMICNDSDDADITIGGGGSEWLGMLLDTSDKINIPAGGMILWAGGPDGKAVVPATGDKITLTNTDGSNAATVLIVVIGTQ